MLTNKQSVKKYGDEISEFTIEEIEVWGVTFQNENTMLK